LGKLTLQLKVSHFKHGDCVKLKKLELVAGLLVAALVVSILAAGLNLPFKPLKIRV
jgi:hypothetical protein